MAWETKDVLLLVLAVAGFAVSWGLSQAKISGLVAQLEKLAATLGAEIKELKRDTQSSLKDQGKRLGELELAWRLQREIARAAGKGTPALGVLYERARLPERSGQVNAPVADGGSSSDDNEGGDHGG